MEKQYTAVELFQMGRGQGLSPEFLLFQEGDPLLEASLRNELGNSHAEEFCSRLHEILPRLIVETKNIDDAQKLTQLILESNAHNLSANSLCFLYAAKVNIRWLLFGIGERIKNDDSILPPKISTDVKYSSALTELKTISQFTAGDIVWIFGRNYQTVPSDTILSLSVSMLVRTLEHIHSVKFVPEMLVPAELIDKLENAIENFKEDKNVFSESIISSIQKLKKHKAKLCCLFFVNRSALHTWKKGSSSPRVVIERIMYILNFLIENHGDKGIAAYIELLDAEAKSRGKINFSTILDSGWGKQ